MATATPASTTGVGSGSPTTLKGSLNPLSSKVTSVLSTSYADSEFRDALALLDSRGLRNTAETRRRLRLDLQKEVIDSNGQIINEFGRVADVSTRRYVAAPLLVIGQGLIDCSSGDAATPAHRQHDRKAE